MFQRLQTQAQVIAGRLTERRAVGHDVYAIAGRNVHAGVILPAEQRPHAAIDVARADFHHAEAAGGQQRSQAAHRGVGHAHVGGALEPHRGGAGVQVGAGGRGGVDLLASADDVVRDAVIGGSEGGAEGIPVVAGQVRHRLAHALGGVHVGCLCNVGPAGGHEGRASDPEPLAAVGSHVPDGEAPGPGGQPAGADEVEGRQVARDPPDQRHADGARSRERVGVRAERVVGMLVAHLERELAVRDADHGPRDLGGGDDAEVSC